MSNKHRLNEKKPPSSANPACGRSSEEVVYKFQILAAEERIL